MPFERVLSHPRSTAALIAIGLALSLASFHQNFITDDLLILSLVEEWYPENTNDFDVYASLIEQAQLPWWASSGASISFFRVLSSSLLRLDHLLFGRWAPGYYLHSLLWFFVLLILTARLYRRILPRLAPVALLLFAVDDCQAFPVGWIANRHALVSFSLGLAGLAAHVRWREEGWRPGLPLSVAGFALGLMAGETGLTLLAYAGAYELFADRSGGRRRWLGLVPPLLIGIGYVAWYRAMGYGFKDAGIYIDPGAQPLAFLETSVTRLPALLGGALTGILPDLWLVPSLRPWVAVLGYLAIFGLAAALLAGWSSFSATEQRHLRWLATGSFLASLPQVATWPSHRQLLAPMFGLAVLLAAFFHLLRRRWWRSAGRWRWIAVALAVAFVLAHVGGAALGRILLPRSLSGMSEAISQMVAQVPEWDPQSGRSEVIVLNAPDIMTLFYGPVFLDYMHGTSRKNWHVLTTAPFDHRITRIGSSTAELEVLGGEMIATPFEVGWPPEKELLPGEVLDREFFQVEVLDAGEVGPTRLRFYFASSLDDSNLLFLTWSEDGFVPISLPVIGEALLLKYIPSRVSLPG